MLSSLIHFWMQARMARSLRFSEAISKVRRRTVSESTGTSLSMGRLSSGPPSSRGRSSATSCSSSRASWTPL